MTSVVDVGLILFRTVSRCFNFCELHYLVSLCYLPYRDKLLLHTIC